MEISDEELLDMQVSGGVRAAACVCGCGCVEGEANFDDPGDRNKSDDNNKGSSSMRMGFFGGGMSAL